MRACKENIISAHQNFITATVSDTCGYRTWSTNTDDQIKIFKSKAVAKSPKQTSRLAQKEKGSLRAHSGRRVVRGLGGLQWTRHHCLFLSLPTLSCLIPGLPPPAYLFIPRPPFPPRPSPPMTSTPVFSLCTPASSSCPLPCQYVLGTCHGLGAHSDD